MRSPDQATNNTRDIDINGSAEPVETVATVEKDGEARLVEETEFKQPVMNSSSKAQNNALSNLEPLSHREEMRPKSQANFQGDIPSKSNIGVKNQIIH